MRADEYNEKIIQLLSDPLLYNKVDQDTKDILYNLEAMVERAYLKGEITEKEKESLIPKNPCPGRFDGFPKTHKVGIPIRPVVSQTNTVTRKLSEFVEKKLHPYVEKMETYNKDTIDVINCINVIKKKKELSKHASTMLMTMDIDSFYTNVTCEMAVGSNLQIIKKQ